MSSTKDNKYTLLGDYKWMITTEGHDMCEYLLLGKHWRATRMGAQYQCSPETDHDFLRDYPLMEFQVEVFQASKWRGSKPVILARHTTLARCTRQDSKLL